MGKKVSKLDEFDMQIYTRKIKRKKSIISSSDTNKNKTRTAHKVIKSFNLFIETHFIHMLKHHLIQKIVIN